MGKPPAPPLEAFGVDVSSRVERQGQLSEAVKLLSAAKARGNWNFSYGGHARLFEYDRLAEATREQLSTEEWEQAWQEGRVMSLEEGIEYALQESGHV